MKIGHTRSAVHRQKDALYAGKPIKKFSITKKRDTWMTASHLENVKEEVERVICDYGDQSDYRGDREKLYFCQFYVTKNNMTFSAGEKWHNEVAH